jgi:hypothetical protein
MARICGPRGKGEGVAALRLAVGASRLWHSPDVPRLAREVVEGDDTPFGHRAVPAGLDSPRLRPKESIGMPHESVQTVAGHLTQAYLRGREWSRGFDGWRLPSRPRFGGVRVRGHQTGIHHDVPAGGHPVVSCQAVRKRSGHRSCDRCWCNVPDAGPGEHRARSLLQRPDQHRGTGRSDRL